MKAKEYLEQLPLLDMRINLKLKELEGLKVKLIGVGSIDYSNDRVQTNTKSDAKYTEILHNIECLESEINDDIDKMINKKFYIAKQIYDMHNKDDIAVLFKRYVEYKKFKEIADELVYSVSYIYYIHNRALEIFEKTYLKNNKSL